MTPSRFHDPSTGRLHFLSVGRRDALMRWVAWRLPRRLAYWVAIRVAAHATAPPHSRAVVPGVTITDMLERW